MLKSSIADEDRWLECSSESCGYEGIRKTFKNEDKKLKCPQCGAVPEEIDDASQEVYSYFVDLVVRDVAKTMAKRDGVTEWNNDVWERYLDLINSGGYSIYATIDPTVQAQVDKI